jgi:hypothetical protein
MVMVYKFVGLTSPDGGGRVQAVPLFLQAAIGRCINYNISHNNDVFKRQYKMGSAIILWISNFFARINYSIAHNIGDFKPPLF